MGFFDKLKGSFSKSEDIWKDPSKAMKYAATGGLLETTKELTTLHKGDVSKNWQNHIFGAGSRGLAAGAVAGSGGLYHLQRYIQKKGSEEGELPPPPGDAPGIGAGTNEAIITARRRAAAEAMQRRRASQTIVTSPLGTTEAAQTSKKKLLGE